MMYNNTMATLTPDEIVMQLVEKEVAIKHEKKLRPEALPFTKWTTKGTEHGKGRERSRSDMGDKDQSYRRSQLTGVNSHKEGHTV